VAETVASAADASLGSGHHMKMQTLTLSAGDAPSAARRAVAGCCADAATGPECAEAAVLMTSELATNALRHGSGPVRLGCDAGEVRVRVEVCDNDRQRPRVRYVDQHSETGRGMVIVDALASAWGVADNPLGGKVVWFEVPAQP
jgi:anti-sigma regulatory factor (Ser/Thr protein kinase)